MLATCGADARVDGGGAAVAAARGTEGTVGAEAAGGFEEPDTGRLLLESSKKSEGRATEEFAADGGAAGATEGLSRRKHAGLNLDR